MNIDAIDAAFIGRCGLRDGPVPVWSAAPAIVVHPPIADPAPARSGADPVPASYAAHDTGPDRPAHDRPLPPPATGPVLDRLLVAAWPQWNRLADTVEEARARGRRVIAVAGSEPGEGRSTLVAGLVRVLRDRGRTVVETAPDGIGAAQQPAHDKRIVLVDAGIWFPPGPIRRQRLTVASLGCEAAILVRRADRQASAAREAVLESLGIEVLGEVVSFADPAENLENLGST